MNSPVLSVMCLLTLLHAASAYEDKPDVQPRAVLDTVCYSDGNYAVAFSRDGKRLASGGSTYSLKLWDVPRGKLALTLGHWGSNPEVPSVEVLAFSPDGKTLAVIDEEKKELQLWPTDGKLKPRRRFKGHGNGVSSLMYSLDGKVLATGCDDGVIRLWDPETGKPRLSLERHKRKPVGLAFSPDSKVLLSGSDGEAFVWNVATGCLIAKLPGHSGWVDSLGISSDGKVALTGDSKNIKVWDLPAWKQRWSRQEDMKLAVLTPNGRYVLLASTRTVVVRHASDGSCAGVHLHPYSFPPRRLLLSPDGGTLAGLNDDSRILLWDVKDLLPKEK